MRLMIRVRLPTRLSLSRHGRLASSASSVGDRDHPAMTALAAQPAQENAHWHRRVQRVSLRPAMLARPRRWLNGDVHFNTSRVQPTRKPNAVAPGLESKRNPFDHLAGLDRLVTPALDQSQQHFRIRPKFFQGLAVNARSYSSHKPSRLAHFHHNYQSGVLIKGDEKAAQIINLGHREPPSLSSSDNDARPRR
jgi:hypothetical protein